MEFKECSKCKLILPREDFHRRRGTKCGIQPMCKKCKGVYSEKTKDRKSKYDRSRLESAQGVIDRAYYHQLHSRIQEKGLGKPEYSREELTGRYLDDYEFKILYNNWVESGFDKNLKPSFDRINPLKGYTFDNLQVITWQQNNEKGRIEKRIIADFHKED